MQKIPESKVLADIRSALGREPDLVIWRLTQGGVVRRGRTLYRAGLSINGAADLIGILTCQIAGEIFGRFFALEIKSSSGGRVSPDQTRWMALVRDRGGFATVVRSANDARNALTRARLGHYS